MKSKVGVTVSSFAECDTYSIDTQEDLEKVVELMKKDALINKYATLK